ncbi:hypothetical protein [Protaetiibacter mangrovi]|uniref:Uncharacterized protein n=1 Tax=Protaetiibacter mangrovi TaxID=2970926 RepID=A0ABT1ZDC4_9MICO|nr:hypothetical protein [Protaetiibacter mangrovi]MCS0498697.1 hypothetical protein [Protaetiibacter mangrovi]TPX03618.1 hypothetical protein FJ656_16200 [Schumannella luteola]
MVAVGTFSACAPAPDELPEGVTVELVQYRFDYGPRRLQLAVGNDSTHEVRVTRVELRSPVFAEPVAYDRGQDVPIGSTRDLPVLLAAPVCDADAAVTAEVAVTAIVDGRAAEGVVVPTDPLGWLDRIHADDCRSAALAASATFTVGPFRVDRATERPTGYLTISGRAVDGGPPASVPTIDRTILFRPADAQPGWPVDWAFDSDDAEQSAELALVPSNCNPHILAEDKRGTFWPLEVELADGDSGIVYLASDDALRAELYSFFQEYCGF